MGDTEEKGSKEQIRRLKTAWWAMEGHFRDLEAALDVLCAAEEAAAAEEDDFDDNSVEPEVEPVGTGELLKTYIRRVREYRELFVNPDLSAEAQQAVRREAWEAMLRVEEELLLRVRA